MCLNWTGAKKIGSDHNSHIGHFILPLIRETLPAVFSWSAVMASSAPRATSDI